MIRRGSFLSNAWLVTGSSLAAVGVLVFLLWSMSSRTNVRGKSLRLFCAAGMRKPVRAVIEQYEKDYGVTIQADYKGTGELMTSLGKIGVPGDLFLSADSTTMQDAVKSGLIAETFKIAEIRPVLVVNRKTHEWLVAANKPIDKLADMVRDDLPDAHFKGGTFKVVLANETAAIGRVGKAILQAHGLWPKLEERRQRNQALVSNVGTVLEVAQRVNQMDGFIGLVWDATAKDYPNLVLMNAPELAEGVQFVELGVLKRSSDLTTALHFARYLTSRDKGLPEFAAHQFKTISDGDVWESRPKLRIAAGSMLQPGLRPVLQEFEKREGIDIETEFMGCGLLVSKMHAIKKGQNPNLFPDVYVSCDVPFAERVSEYFEGITNILDNDLVIIVPKGNPKHIKPSLEELKRDDLKKVGLPNPAHSAMGERIVKTLQNLGFPQETWDANINPRISNTSSADLLVGQIGSMDLAIVARSNAVSHRLNQEKRLEILEIAEGLRTTQTFGIAHGSPHKHLGERLLRAILTPQSLARFQSVGFYTEPKK